MSVKLYWRPILVGEYDISGMETWLSNMAEKGYLLYDLGHLFGKFTKSEPKKIRYRLEPVGSDPEYPTLLMKDLYEENGWRYIATFRKLFHVFMTEDTSAQEIHTDPVVQSQSLEMLSRRRRNAILFSSIYELVFILLTISGLLFRNLWVRYYILDFNPALYVAIPVYILMGIFIVISDVPLFKLRRNLRVGRPLEHHKNYKHAVMLKVITSLLVLLSLILLVSPMIFMNKTGIQSTRSLSEAPSDMPVLRFEYLDPDYADTVDAQFYTEYSPFVPEQYVVMQSLQSDDTKRTVLQTEYYKVSFSSLVGTVYDEILRRHLERFNATTSRREMQDYETLHTPLFDKAAYARIKNSPYNSYSNDIAQYIIAYRDKTVIVVRYEGDEDLRDKLAIIADVFL